MSTLAKVVQHLRKEHDQAQNRLDQLDEALKALTGLSGAGGIHERRSGADARKAQNDLSSGSETDRGGATYALGEVESCSASEVNGMGPRFTHSHSQIFRFNLSFALTAFARLFSLIDVDG